MSSGAPCRGWHSSTGSDYDPPMLSDGQLHLIDKVFSLAAIAVRWGCGTYAAVTIGPAFAGKVTIADVTLSVFGKEWSAAWVVALIAVTALWAILERAVRQSKTAALTARIAELERRHDPARTSSGLQRDGRSRPEDL